MSQTKRQLIIVLASLLPLLGLMGCEDNLFEGSGDGDSYEGRMEEARSALDSRDYVRAAAILRDLDTAYPNTPEVKATLSNALAGQAGLDTFRILVVLDNLEEADRYAGSIDVVGLVLGAEDGTITRNQADEKRALIREAMNLLGQLPQMSPDQSVQNGLLALNHAVLVLAQIIMDDRQLDSMKLTKAGVIDIYHWQAALNPAAASADRLASLSHDLAIMDKAVQMVLEITGTPIQENRLATHMSGFLRVLDRDSDGEIVLQELQKYLNNL